MHNKEFFLTTMQIVKSVNCHEHSSSSKLKTCYEKDIYIVCRNDCRYCKKENEIIYYRIYYNCDNVNFSQCIYTIIHVVCIRNILHYQVHVYY